jgi:hypothetical protein
LEVAVIDFQKLVREKVASCKLEPMREAAIVDEISQHMRTRRRRRSRPS